jgi:hypothetical protein
MNIGQMPIGDAVRVVQRAVVRSAAKNGNIQPGLGQRRGNAH